MRNLNLNRVDSFQFCPVLYLQLEFEYWFKNRSGALISALILWRVAPSLQYRWLLIKPKRQQITSCVKCHDVLKSYSHRTINYLKKLTVHKLRIFKIKIYEKEEMRTLLVTCFWCCCISFAFGSSCDLRYVVRNKLSSSLFSNLSVTCGGDQITVSLSPCSGLLTLSSFCSIRFNLKKWLNFCLRKCHCNGWVQ